MVWSGSGWVTLSQYALVWVRLGHTEPVCSDLGQVGWGVCLNLIS